MTPWLTQDEVNDLCAPLKQRAAQVGYLKKLGLSVREKPNGAPLVLRSNVEQVLGNSALARHGKTRSREPDREGLLLAFGKR